MSPRVIWLNGSSGYCVDGLPQASPTFRVRAEAEKWLRAELARLPESRRPRERDCLRCGRSFESEGHHNRMCTPCRTITDPMPGLVNISAARGSGRVGRIAKRASI